jgi:peptide/nickel transport system substrate-binding protein
MNPKPTIFLLSLLILIVGCGGPAPVTDQLYEERDGAIIYHGEKTNEVSVHLSANPSSLHPINSELATRYEILDLCYQRLLSVDIETGALVPELVQQMPTVSEDGLTYFFELHPQAAWNDGSPITAADIIFSTKLLVCPQVDNQSLRPYLAYLEDIQADPTDPRKFQVKMKEYYLNNDNFGIFSYVMDQRVYDPEGVLNAYTIVELMEENGPATKAEDLEDWAEEFNSAKYGQEVNRLNHGSGPYQMTEWLTDERIVLSRNDAYWGKELPGYLHSQYPDQIIFKMVKDGQAAELQFKEQLLDVSTRLDPQVYQSMIADSSITRHYHLGVRNRSSFTSLALNNRPNGIDQARIFDDARVRRAFALAIPRQRFIDELLDGMGTIAASPVPPHNAHYHKGIQPLPYDPIQPEALLEEAGWVDTDADGVRDKVVDGKRIPLSFSLLFPPRGQLYTDMCTFIQQEVAKVGMDCQPEGANDYAVRVQAKNYDASLLSLRASELPYDFKQTFHSENWPNGTNYFGYANARADLLMDSLRVEPRESIRLKLATEIQEILAQEQPCVFMFYPVNKIAIHRRFNRAKMYGKPNFVLLNDLELITE